MEEEPGGMAFGQGGRIRAGRRGLTRVLATVGLVSTAAFAAIALPVSGGDTITTVVGVGTQGYSGDGGPATAAELFDPTDIVIDSSGNRYVVEMGNHVVRTVDAAGTITTVAGTGVAGSSGDGGPATAAQLTDPVGLAFDGVEIGRASCRERV